MSAKQLAAALRILRPNAPFEIEGEEYSGIVWKDPVQTKPTEEEIAGVMPQVYQLEQAEALQAQIDELHLQMTDTVILEALAGDSASQTLVTTTLEKIQGLHHQQATGAPAPWSNKLMLARVKAAANDVVNGLVSIQIDALANNDTATVAACVTAKNAILSLISRPSVLAATDDASLAAALKAEYAAIVLATPDNIKAAYAGFRV